MPKITVLPDQDTPKDGRKEQPSPVLEQIVDEGVRSIETANRAALDLSGSRAGTKALHDLAEAAQALSHARYAAISVVRPDGAGLLEFVTIGLTLEEGAVMGPHPQRGSILGLLLKRAESVRADIPTDHVMSLGFPRHCPSMERFLGIPIRHGDTILGGLYLTDKEGGGLFTEADQEAVQALGDHAAVASHHLHLLTQQRALACGIIAAEEEERRALAYDLHDGLTQYIMAAYAHLESFRDAQETGDAAKAQRDLDVGLSHLKAAVVESRRLINGLRSLALDDSGLPGALEQLLREDKECAGWEDVEFLHNIVGRRYHKTLETTIYRVTQEALTNVRKHAQATHVRVTLLAEPVYGSEVGQLVLKIQDWGRGFVPEQCADSHEQVGLQSMRERAALLGGTYLLQSVPGEGTVIRAVFPALDAASEEGSDVA